MTVYREVLVAREPYTGWHPRRGEDEDIVRGTVLKHGYYDMTKDGDYDETKHDIIQTQQDLPDVHETDVYYNYDTEEFQDTPP